MADTVLCPRRSVAPRGEGVAESMERKVFRASTFQDTLVQCGTETGRYMTPVGEEGNSQGGLGIRCVPE